MHMFTANSNPYCSICFVIFCFDLKDQYLFTKKLKQKEAAMAIVFEKMCHNPIKSVNTNKTEYSRAADKKPVIKYLLNCNIVLLFKSVILKLLIKTHYLTKGSIFSSISFSSAGTFTLSISVHVSSCSMVSPGARSSRGLKLSISIIKSMVYVS